MSWKGFQKAVSRLPARMTRGGTDDEEYALLSKRVADVASNTRFLYDKVHKIKDSLNAMSRHQHALAVFFVEVMQPLTADDPALTDDSIKSIASTEYFRDRVEELRDSLTGDLDFLERQVVAPTYEFSLLLYNVRRLMDKRDRKRVDYDRHQQSIQKLRSNQSRTVNDERKLGQLDADFDVASRDYNNLNNIIKQEVPVLLKLKDDFIGTVFLTLYSYQRRYYERVTATFQDIITNCQSSFGPNQDPNLDFQPRYHRMLQVIEQISFVTKSPAVNMGRVSPSPASGNYDNRPVTSTYVAPQYESKEQEATQDQAGSTEPLPTYVDNQGSASSVDKFCVALFDYEAQADGDLAFKKGERITILERSDDVDDWWRGRNEQGVEGIFPANFVQLA